jgi:hypothetical protein
VNEPAPRPASAANGEHRQIARRAGIVASGTLASRALGLVRDQTIAAVFSRGVTDAVLRRVHDPERARAAAR